MNELVNEMANTHVLSGLAAKRSELAGELNHLKAEMQRVTDEVKVVEAAIKVFDPDYDLRTLKAKAKRTKNNFFKHGEANKLVQDILRESQSQLTTQQIAERAAHIKGLNLAEIDAGALRACILTVLSRLRSNGVVIEAGRDESLAINWQLP